MNDALAPTRPLCILHSDDAELRHRLAAILHERAYVCHAPDQIRLEELLGGSEPLVLFIDLRVEGGLELLPRLSRLHPQAVTVALGHHGQRSLPDGAGRGRLPGGGLAADRKTLRDLADRVFERVGWMQETHMLRDELARLRAMQQHAALNGRSQNGGGPGRNPLGLQHLIKATQHLDRLEGVVRPDRGRRGKRGDGFARGFFLPARRTTAFYRLHAGRCCLEDTAALEFSDRDPLVRWLQRHPRLITRASLDHIADPTERTLLRRSLDLLGAETFIPLNLRGRVLGWFFTGSDRRAAVRPPRPPGAFLPERTHRARRWKTRSGIRRCSPRRRWAKTCSR